MLASTRRRLVLLQPKTAEEARDGVAVIDPELGGLLLVRAVAFATARSFAAKFEYCVTGFVLRRLEHEVMRR